MVIRPRRRAATEPPTPIADRPLYYYSVSLDRTFPVARLDWAASYQERMAASPHLDNEELLTNLLREVSKETRSAADPLHDMPWYQRENTQHSPRSAPTGQLQAPNGRPNRASRTRWPRGSTMSNPSRADQVLGEPARLEHLGKREPPA